MLRIAPLSAVRSGSLYSSNGQPHLNIDGMAGAACAPPR